jgi:predicted dehydrogenase
MKKQNKQSGKIRYAVVGLGHIAQNAILPGFVHARKKLGFNGADFRRSHQAAPIVQGIRGGRLLRLQRLCRLSAERPH